MKRTESLSSIMFNGFVDFRTLAIIRFKINKRFYNVTIDDLAEHGLLEFIIRFPNKRCTRNAVVMAARKGHLNVVKWFCENRPDLYSNDLPYEAAHNGHWDILKYLHSIGRVTFWPICSAAARGDLDIVKYICEHGRLCVRPEVYTNAMTTAAGRGHIEVVKYFHGIGVHCNKEAMKEAAVWNHMEVLKYLYHVVKAEAYFPPNTLKTIAGQGHLDVIKFLHENKILRYPSVWTKTKCYDISDAVSNGRLEVIKFLYENELVDGCSAPSIVDASRHGHLEVLKYIYEKEITIWDSLPGKAIKAATETGRLDIVQFLVSVGETFNEKAMDEAVSGGHLEVVKYLRSVGAVCLAKHMDTAAENGDLEMVKYFYETGVQCTGQTADNAAGNDHMEVVKYLLSKGVVCTGWAMFYSAGKSIEMVKYLHSLGLPCQPDVMDYPAVKGDLEMLKWFYENRSERYSVSVMYGVGRLDVLKYLYSIGATCGDSEITYAAAKGHLEVVKYLHSIGESAPNPP